MKFDSKGENTALQATTFQWQNGALVPTLPKGSPGTKQADLPEAGMGVVNPRRQGEQVAGVVSACR